MDNNKVKFQIKLQNFQLCKVNFETDSEFRILQQLTSQCALVILCTVLLHNTKNKLHLAKLHLQNLIMHKVTDKGRGRTTVKLGKKTGPMEQQE